MSDDLYYKLEISIKNGSSIEDVENKLQDLLMDLYDVDTVEGILVKDRTPPIDEDMEELLAVIDSVENKDIRQAIELVRELEAMGDE